MFQENERKMKFWIDVQSVSDFYAPTPIYNVMWHDFIQIHLLIITYGYQLIIT